ncbi:MULTISPECIES: DUF1801 domain-containing protein [unclassified Roseateles]|uniref:DUF1801 domain-containing protein n=1 Tax=unclassified Roseateles TaxID=2626991 RepID=UPI0006F2FA09|nr:MULTISPECIES: DUF1801 domain-containing protein [unclassified Roseateles]KQW46559.1 hypothetical protein ASC81_09170 [Pelomonas sp. Root405]KRA73610.1 hypothetical protein ASD88_09170 [Pelomonas sp. Root662]
MYRVMAADPDGYVAALDGWRQAQVAALRAVVRQAQPGLEEKLKWGHLVYFGNGPVLLIRAEESRVLFGFWRGKRLLDIEPRMRGGGKFELRTLALREDTPFGRETAMALVKAAAALDARLGDPTRRS